MLAGRLISLGALLLASACVAVGGAPAHAAHDPVAAVSGLITRILGAAALPRFRLEAIAGDASGLDVFETDSDGERVVLRGNTGVSLATALNNYLKYR